MSPKVIVTTHKNLPNSQKLYKKKRANKIDKILKDSFMYIITHNYISYIFK